MKCKKDTKDLNFMGFMSKNNRYMLKSTELDQLLQQKPKNHRRKRNLNLEEQKGLKWLQQNVNLHRIAIQSSTHWFCDFARVHF